MKSYIRRWLLLVSVILQIDQLRSDFVFGTFFLMHPVYALINKTMCVGNSGLNYQVFPIKSTMSGKCKIPSLLFAEIIYTISKIVKSKYETF